MTCDDIEPIGRSGSACPTAELTRKGFLATFASSRRMTLRELVVAYFQYPAILAYGVLAALAIGLAVWRPAGVLATVPSIAIAVLVYPLVWYVPPPLGAAQPLDVQGAAARRDLEADPL